MPEITSYEPGTPSFIDLATTDLEAAKVFYTELFGWDAVDMPMPDGGVYTMLSKGGKDVAGAYVLNNEMAAMGVPPHWVSYYYGLPKNSLRMIFHYLWRIIYPFLFLSRKALKTG